MLLIQIWSSPLTFVTCAPTPIITLKNIKNKFRKKPLVFLYMEYFVENRQDLRNLHQMKFCL